MKYYAKFDTEGNRITSIVEGVHFNTAEELKRYTDDGFIQISEADQELYATNEYIRDTETKKPIPKPPYEQTLKDQANALSKQYESQIAELKDALAVATLADDEETMSDLRIEYADLMKKYQDELEVLNNA